MTEWKLTDNRVHGHGQNYTLHNKITAKQLHKTLTTYEKTTELNKNIEEQFDKITKQIIQVKMSLSVLNSEIQTLSSDINALNEAK